MTYGHLESIVDKWSLQLQEQEKHFFHQVNHLNVWNQALIENGDEVGRYSH